MKLMKKTSLQFIMNQKINGYEIIQQMLCKMILMCGKKKIIIAITNLMILFLVTGNINKKMLN